MYRSIRFDLAITDPANEAARMTPVKVYLCPSDAGPEIVDVYDCGNPPSAAATPTVITEAAMCSYVGCLGGGYARNPDPLCGCYE